MHVFRKIVAASAAAIVVMASGIPVAQADSPPSVYTTPGGQISDGRLWNTNCEKYSTSVVRCSTDIWATTVVYKNGGYVQKKGWVFNNLSYLASARASWANNNLGRNNPNWTSEGRKWRTECDTATTGRGGCRSYIWAKTVRAVKSGSGYRYVNKNEWVFNNVVLFSSKSIPAVKKVPAWIIDQSRLSLTGLGPLQVGTSMKDLTTLGYMVYPDECQGYGVSNALMDRGIGVRNMQTKSVADVTIWTKGVKTVDGAQVGMTLAQLKGIYGPKLRLEEKYDGPGDSQLSTAVVQSGGDELVFSFGQVEALGGPLEDSDIIVMMVARPISPIFNYDGC